MSTSNGVLYAKFYGIRDLTIWEWIYNRIQFVVTKMPISYLMRSWWMNSPRPILACCFPSPVRESAVCFLAKNNIFHNDLGNPLFAKVLLWHILDLKQ
jgi:hypothetical protein